MFLRWSSPKYGTFGSSVFQLESWSILGSIVGSEITAAALDLKVGTVRRDPFAMLPFCGYHMGDYFAHWINIAKKTSADKLPKIFYVNWFRKSADGKFLWPGYGENSRVLKWIFERTEGTASAVETAIGYLPTVDAIDTEGLKVSKEDMEEMLKVKNDEWLKEVESIKEHYTKFGDRLPKELKEELAALEARLKSNTKLLVRCFMRSAHQSLLELYRRVECPGLLKPNQNGKQRKSWQKAFISSVSHAIPIFSNRIS